MILEKTIRVKELPASLQVGNDPEGFVRVFVQTLTENGFTEEFEQGVLEAEKELEASDAKPVPIEEFIKMLKSELEQ
jgi:hypothetical protein